jgi:toxin ParE1/3/4
VKRLDIKAAARAELAQIYDFSREEFGMDVAEAYMAGLRGAFDRLLEFPLLGPVYAGVTPEVRLFLHRSHRIFYRVEKDVVLIVRVLHKRRDVRAVFG